MKILKYTLAVLFLVTAAQGLLAQDKAAFPGIEKLMSGEEFQAAGLDKLTPAEREALDNWLIRYTVKDRPVLLNKNKEVSEAMEEKETAASIAPTDWGAKEAVEEQPIVAVIQQPFKGWSGDTIFKLDNGQVWKQRRKGNYHYTGSRPEVRISKNFVGLYRMELVENGKSVQVKRLK